MKILVKKMSSFGILKAQMIFGAVVMIAAMACLPVAILTSGGPSLLLNPYVLGVVIITMAIFALFAYFLFTFRIGIFIFLTTNPFVNLMNFKLNIPSQV